MTPNLPLPDISACIEFAKLYKKLFSTTTDSARDIAIAVAKDSNLKIPTNFKYQWEKQNRARPAFLLRDCGTGSGGFQPGNSCAGGEGNTENFDPGSDAEREVMKNGEVVDIEELMKSAYGEDATYQERMNRSSAQYGAVTTFTNEEGQLMSVALKMTHMIWDGDIPTSAEMKFLVNGSFSAKGPMGEAVGGKGEGLKVIRLVTLMMERYLATHGSKVETVTFSSVHTDSQSHGRERLYDGLVKRLGKKMGASKVVKTQPTGMKETEWQITIPQNKRSKNTDRIITFVLPSSAEQRDCGTGSGGFQPGNSCAGGEGGGNVSIKDSVGPKQPGDWMKKKGYPTEIENAFQAKAYAILIAQHKADGQSKKNSQALALADLITLDLFPEAADAFISKYDLDRNDYNIKANTLKNDPGIYAAEKAIASGKIGVGTQDDPPATDEGLARPPVAPPPPPSTPPPEISKPALGKSKAGIPKEFEQSKVPALTQKEKDFLAVSDRPHFKSGTKYRPGQVTDAYQKMREAGEQAKDDIDTFNAQIPLLEAAYQQEDPLKTGSPPQQKAMTEIGRLDCITRMSRNGPPPAEVYSSHRGDQATVLESLKVGETFTNRTFTVGTYDLENQALGINLQTNDPPKVVIKTRTSYGYQVPANNNSTSSHSILPRNSRLKIKSKEWREINGKQVLFVEVDQIGVAA